MSDLFGKVCPDCRGISIYRREVEGVEDIKCGDCGAVFGEVNLMRKSPIRKIQEAQAKMIEEKKLPVVWLMSDEMGLRFMEDDRGIRHGYFVTDKEAKFSEPYIPVARLKEALDQLDPCCEGKAIDALRALLSDVEGA